MKKTITNIMFTSNAVLVFLAIYAIIIKANAIYARTVFEVLGVNIIIHLGIFFTGKFESRYVIFEYLLDIGYILTVLGISGLLLKWYTGHPPMWYIFIIAVIVYIFSIILNIARTRKTAKRINELLQKRKKRRAALQVSL